MQARPATGTILAAMVLFGCGDKNTDEETTVLDSGGLSEADTDTDADADTDMDTDSEVSGALSGTLRLQLYREDEDGVREYVSWDQAYDEYPFGSAFITTYIVGPSGGMDYPGSTVVAFSDIDLDNGNTYEIPLTVNSADAVQVYASVDYARDQIISPTDPVGVYPAEIQVEEGDTIDGIDITVLLPYYDFGKGGVEGGMPTGSGCDDVVLSGNIIVDRSDATGLAAAMLIDSAGYGPYDYGLTTLINIDDEEVSAGSYSFTTCDNYGNFDLRGAWDLNQNDLIDPADLWGSYADEGGADANPVTIATSDLIDYDIQIPLGTPGLTILPFTELTGVLRVKDGDFDDLPESTSAIYIVAMKYRPTQDMSRSYLYDRSYDVFELERSDYAGKPQISYSLGVPSDSIMYLWAFADNNSDGVVNGPDEYVGSGGGANGRILTVEGTNSGNDIAIGLSGK